MKRNGQRDRTVATGQWLKNTGGNTALVFALCLPVLLMVVGGAIDFANAQRIKQQLQDAADIASLGIVAANSPSYLNASNMNGMGKVPGADKAAQQMFDRAIASKVSIKGVKAKAKVTRSQTAVTSRMDVTGKYPTIFLGLFGFSTLPLDVTSESVAALPTYTDFYLLLDNTPSMGLGATTQDIATMVVNTPDKCAFACHQMDKTGTGKNGDYYNLAKFLGVQTRIDVVRTATKDMMATAKATATIPNQYSMAIYHFGPAADQIDAKAPKAWQVSPMTPNLDKAAKDADAIDLMTIPYQNYNSDRQTNFNSVLSSMNTNISSPGNGSTPGKAQKVLFIVSDGINDGYDCAYNNGGTCRRITPIDPAQCQAIKDRGVRIAVLYTTYLPLPTNAFYNSWVAKYVPNQIANNMKACASPGLYFEVSPSEGIGEAMNALFKKVVSTVRITS